MIRSARWIRRGAVRFGLPVFLALLLAVALGWRAGQATGVALAPVAATVWALPTQQTVSPEKEAGILRERHAWGGRAAFRDIDAGPAVPTGQPWTLVGTVLRDNRRFALIRMGPQPTGALEYRTAGEKMPDGSTLEQVDADSITISGGSGRRPGKTVFRLFEKRS